MGDTPLAPTSGRIGSYKRPLFYQACHMKVSGKVLQVD